MSTNLTEADVRTHSLEPVNVDKLNELREINTSVPHTTWADGNSDEEINRFELESDEKLEIWRMDVNWKGGGSHPEFKLELYDEINDSSLVATTDTVREWRSGCYLGCRSRYISAAY